MAQIKLTKNSLRLEEAKLIQLKRYLPTLQLKKSLLQLELSAAYVKIEKLREDFVRSKVKVEEFAPLLSEKRESNISPYLEIELVKKRYENIAGLEIPIFEDVIFRQSDYGLFETPSWSDYVIIKLRQLIMLKEMIQVEEEKKRALQKELKDVSIRVNLFEKVLIPRISENIKAIKIFLGDQELAAVARAKVAKSKIESRKEQIDDYQGKKVSTLRN